MQQFYFVILNPSRSLPLSIPEAAWGGAGCTLPPGISSSTHGMKLKLTSEIPLLK